MANKIKDLVQVNPQLYKWLRTFNTRSLDDKVAQNEDSVKWGGDGNGK